MDGQQATKTTHREPDLLLFSDVHLGSDIKRGALQAAGGLEALAQRDALDRAVGGMLDHYLAKGEGPWRVIVAGDLVDFIGMHVVPSDLGETAPFEPTEDEQLYGLEPGPERCAWMMRLVLRRHPYFFERLAAFVAGGHEVVLVRGNHDAAFYWPEVQWAFREGLLDAATRIGESLTLEQVEAAVRFEDWFHLEPGRIYVEHGHAHDEACSDPDGRLTDEHRPDRLSQPVSTLSLRYFANRFPTLDLDNVDSWHAWDFVRWAFLKENPLKIFLAFAHTMALLLVPSLRQTLRAHRRERSRGIAAPTLEPELELVRRAIVRLSRPEKLIRALGKRIARTARISTAGVLRMFCLDRAAAVGTGVALSAGSIALELPWTWKAGIVAAFLVAGFILERHLAASRQVAIAPKLRSAAEELAPHLDVPLVVMGHSHKAVDSVLPDGTRYVNLGSWLPANRPEAATMGLPHLVLRHGAPGELLRWVP